MVIRRLELEQPREEAEVIAVSPLASKAKSGVKSREVRLSECGLAREKPVTDNPVSQALARRGW
jgi:hypothetical protein